MQLRIQPVRKAGLRRASSVTVGFSAPGVQLRSGRGKRLDRPVLQPFRCWPLGTPKADEALLLTETGQYLQVATVAARGVATPGGVVTVGRGARAQAQVVSI